MEYVSANNHIAAEARTLNANRKMKSLIRLIQQKILSLAS
jgi:hypothetical protein